jgi:hypothetical protein
MRTTVLGFAAVMLAGILVAACGAAATPTPAATAAPTSAAIASADPTTTPAPTATPLPTTPGTGDQFVTGTEGSVALLTNYTETKVGEVTQLRGGVVSAYQTMNDPRVTGRVTYSDINLDTYTKVAPEWMKARLENDGGAWEGSCTGASWDSGTASDGTCWLVGTGGYAGYTYYYYHSLGGGTTGNVQGIIYPGSPPKP